MRQRTTCPEPSVLKRLIEGSLAGTELSSIESHTDACEACQTTIESLSPRSAGESSSDQLSRAFGIATMG